MRGFLHLISTRPVGKLILGTLIAEMTGVEYLDLMDGTIALQECVAGVCMLCGNDTLNGGEECDDGNLTNGDGCASDCTVE